MHASPFPFAGQLLTGAQLGQWLYNAMPTVEGPLLVCSAFIRSEALRGLLGRLRKPTGGKVLVRWRYGDIVSGASDLAVYELCRKYGLQLHMRLDFHGKVYALPPAGIAVGSANVTMAGLSLRQQANEEIGTLVPLSESNIALIEELFRGTTLVDDQLHGMLLDACESASSAAPMSEWPQHILHLMLPTELPPHLLVDECLWSDGGWVAKDRIPQSEAERHDQSLLGLGAGATLDEIQQHLLRSAIVGWLKGQLEQADGHELYFGGLTERLHNTLLDDPAPRRSEVKGLLQNLLGWLQRTGMPGIAIDQPRHSQRVRLTTQ